MALLNIQRRPGVANFDDIIKIATEFTEKKLKIQTSIKDSKLCIKMHFGNSVSVFLDITKVADFWWKNADVRRNQGVCHVIYILFWSSLGKI